MARIPSAIPALALVAALVAACETAPPPPPSAPPQAAEPASGTDGDILRQRRGWTVTLHRTDGKPSLCLASRLGAPGATLAFATTATEGRVLLRGVSTNAQPGTVATLNAVVEGAEPVNLSAILRTDGTLAAVLPFAQFEQTVSPFAHGRRVTFEGAAITQAPKSINLIGSEWAINSVLECRILHLTTPKQGA